MPSISPISNIFFIYLTSRSTIASAAIIISFLHKFNNWLSSSKTGKARASIRRYWQDKLTDNTKEKEYSSTLVIDLPHEPGVLGEISTLIGINGSNIINVELLEKKDKFLQFSFDLQIKDLKNFTNLISQIKQKNLDFKIIRHKEKKNAFIQRFIKNFKRN